MVKEYEQQTEMLRRVMTAMPKLGLKSLAPVLPQTEQEGRARIRFLEAETAKQSIAKGPKPKINAARIDMLSAFEYAGGDVHSANTPRDRNGPPGGVVIEYQEAAEIYVFGKSPGREQLKKIVLKYLHLHPARAAFTGCGGLVADATVVHNLRANDLVVGSPVIDRPKLTT